MSVIKTHESTSKVVDKIKIIDLIGSIDAYNITDVIEYIKKIIDTSNEHFIVFNMEELTFITAQAISSFVNLVHEYSNNEYSFIYVMGMSSKIKEMFNLLGFEGCCNMIDNISEVGGNTRIFPINIKCDSCEYINKIFKSGRFKCKSCKTILQITNKGKLRQ